MASVHHPHARPNIPLPVCVPDLAKPRRLVYRCIESMLDVSDVADYRRAMMMLYGADRLRQAETLLNRSERFFRLETLGADMQGSAAMHRTLPAAYDKLFASSADAVA